MPKELSRKHIPIFCLVLALSLASGVVFGSVNFVSIINFSEQEFKILWNLRLPRVICSALVGATLAVCGVIVQTMLRNPLACPYTLGASQAVSLVLFAFIFYGFFPGLFLVLFIFVGFVFLFTSFRTKSLSSINISQSIILIGLALGTFCSSLILALQFLLDGISLMQMTRWMMGGLSVVGYLPLLSLLLAFLFLFIFGLIYSESLDWLVIGEEFAMSRGVGVKGLTYGFSALVFVCIAIVVWISGPIGFVGLIIPHAVRLLGFFRHKDLLLLSAVFGASFLILSDLASRIVFSPIEIPVGVVTGVVGTPCFVFLLIRSLLRAN